MCTRAAANGGMTMDTSPDKYTAAYIEVEWGIHSPPKLRSHAPRTDPALACQGLADAFIKMRLPFDSLEAAKLNRDIFETIYFGAVNASVEVSNTPGGQCASVTLRCARNVLAPGPESSIV